jgi:integrase
MRIYTHPKTDMIYLDFVVDGKRKRKSTGLKYSKENIKLVQTQIAPTIQRGISTGTLELDSKKKSVIVDDIFQKECDINRHNRNDRVKKNHIMDYNSSIKKIFGNRAINTIIKDEIQDWQNDLLDRLAYGSVEKRRWILKGIFQVAVDDGLIEKNLVEEIKLPKKKKQKKDPFLKDEIEKLIAVSSDSFGDFLKVAFFTGMRTGEQIALKWDNIDFENRMIRIEATRSRGVEGYTKNNSSFRTIDMIDIVYQTLMKIHKQKRSDEYVFVNRFNKPYYTSDALNIMLGRYSKKAGIKKRTIYNTRHTFATMMLNNNEDIMWVSHMLGHSTTETTFKNYASFIKQRKTDRANFLQSWHISGTPK